MTFQTNLPMTFTTTLQTYSDMTLHDLFGQVGKKKYNLPLYFSDLSPAGRVKLTP